MGGIARPRSIPSGVLIIVERLLGQPEAVGSRGAHAFARLSLRPMLVFEGGHSSGDVSLAAPLLEEAPRAPDPGITLADIVEHITVGGWPATQSLPVKAALRTIRAVRVYVGEGARTDIRRVDGVVHNPERIERFLRATAQT